MHSRCNPPSLSAGPAGKGQWKSSTPPTLALRNTRNRGRLQIQTGHRRCASANVDLLLIASVAVRGRCSVGRRRVRGRWRRRHRACLAISRRGRGNRGRRRRRNVSHRRSRGGGWGEAGVRPRGGNGRGVRWFCFIGDGGHRRLLLCPHLIILATAGEKREGGKRRQLMFQFHLVCLV